MPKQPKTVAPSSRRGSYAALAVLVLPVMVGLGALAIDTSYMRLAHSQSQDVADAAATAAMYTLRRTSDVEEARRTALQTCEANVVVGEAPDCLDIDFGEFDDGQFSAGENGSAVRVVAGRTGSAAPSLFFARLWGYDQFDTQAVAVAESRQLELIVAMDITVSWNPRDFEQARAAAVSLLDTLAISAGNGDRIGMVVYNGPHSWELTPFTALDDPSAVADIRAQWSSLQLASMAGEISRCRWPRGCNGYYKWPWRYNTDELDALAGGFYPNMPRLYPYEWYTDYTPGLMMAQTMFDEGNDDSFRGLIFLTDGRPNEIPSYTLNYRSYYRYEETRWRGTTGPIPHSNSAIYSDSLALTQQMWNEMSVHTWMISFVADNQSLSGMQQGQGYDARVSTGANLVEEFQRVAESLPVVLAD
jgi:hypothetical protein